MHQDFRSLALQYDLVILGRFNEGTCHIAECFNLLECSRLHATVISSPHRRKTGQFKGKHFQNYLAYFWPAADRTDSSFS
jgi:hypothetical protein